MSFFYLSPAKGDLQVHLLETIVSKRLKFLKAVLSGDSLEYNEYMIDGSVYDNIGHFTLCTLAIVNKNVDYDQFLLKSEVELFKSRLYSLSAYDLRGFAKKTLRIIRKLKTAPSYVISLQVLCQHLKIKELAQHVCSVGHNKNCCMHFIKLHFKRCLDFIAKRQVQIIKGTVSVPCGKWKEYLVILYLKHLKGRLINTDLKSLLTDSRIIDLAIKFRYELKNYVSKEEKLEIVMSKDVDNVAMFFPPCMLNLHKSLRHKHRLSHYQRFYYSLFLKDIGMPIEEAINFWRNEYLQTPCGTNNCSHSWEKDEKKYLYGIRHMYGLEGARRKYTSVDCQCLQSNESSCSEGGCPFRSFDDKNLIDLIKPDEKSKSQILEFKRKQKYISACSLYLRTTFPNNSGCDKVAFNFTPVNYYKYASNIKSKLEK